MLQNLSQIKEATTNYQAYKVQDYWKASGNKHTKWREWITQPTTCTNPVSANTQTLAEELAKRKIQVRTEMDILRWGYRPNDTFTLQEAYHLHADHNSNNEQEIWKIIWQSNQWPKITYFLWQTLHNNILPWDNLLKRGFEGLSNCYPCKQQEETMLYLLITFPFIAKLWNEAASKFRRSSLNRASVEATIKNWTQNPFQNSLLNQIWHLTLGFILWYT